MRKAMAGKKLLFISILLIAAMAALSPAHAAGPAPSVSILNPAHGTQPPGAPSVISNSPAAGGSFKVQVYVWNDVDDITAVAVEHCDGLEADPDGSCSWTSVDATLNTNYSCGDGCGVYDVVLTLTPENDYWLRARATSTADGTGYSSDTRTGNNARYTYISLVNPKVGTGTLLARDMASVMCMDCHGQITSHSSQSTDAGYGNWQNACLTCHTPHSTTNIYLIKEEIITPNSGTRPVDFRKATTVYNGTGGYVDGGAGEGTEGICQVCHTQTSRWTNTAPGDGHFYTTDCKGCHVHDSGFKGEDDMCADCHLTATSTSDTNDYAPGGAKAMISRDEWEYSGHGLPAGSKYDMTETNGADFPAKAGDEDPCLYCHDDSVNHEDGTNYFRLRLNGYGAETNPLNGVCRGCHEAGSSGVDPGAGYTPVNGSKKVNKYHYGGDHEGTDGGRWCFDCHDPHGDSTSTSGPIVMIQLLPVMALDVANDGKPSTFGGPVSFSDNTKATDPGGFAIDSGTYDDGICNTCHTSTTYYKNNLGKNGHYTTLCTGCHAHDANGVYDGKAFEGAGDCNACHGYPPNLNDGKANINGVLGGKGAHWSFAINGAHIDNSALDAANDTYGTGLVQCVACHPMADASHPDNDKLVDIGFGVANRFDSGEVTYGGVVGQVPNSTPKICTNVNCHFGAPTPRWSCPDDQ